MRRLVTAVMVLAALVSWSAAQVRVEKVNYRGWRNTIKISNGLMEVYVTTDVGPRIVDIRPIGGNNIFYLRPDEVGKSGEKEFKLRGGWRPWIAPERYDTTWFPDNHPITYQRLKDGTLRFFGPKEPTSGIQKIVDVKVMPNEPCVWVTMRLRNVSKKPVTYAAWSLPVMKPHGKAIAPLDVGNVAAFAEVRRLILWSYTNPTDPRFTFFNKLIIVDHAKVPPREKVIGEARVAQGIVNRRHNDEAKIGVDSKQGWVAYYHPIDRTLFVKRFPVEPRGNYPDGGCTIEIYSCQEFIEVECLSPLASIRPGGEYVFPMAFWVFPNVPDLGATEHEIATALRQYLNKTQAVKW